MRELFCGLFPARFAMVMLGLVAALSLEVVISPDASAAFTPVDIAPQQTVAWGAFRPYHVWNPPAAGRQWFNQVPFEISGIIQTAGGQMTRATSFRPTRVVIPIDRKFTTLHLLHFGEFVSPHGRANALAILHYADGQEQRFPLRYGVHYQDWHHPVEGTPATHPDTEYAWAMLPLSDPASRMLTAIWQTAFANPRPGAVVSTLEIRSLLTESRYSLVAVTLEQGQTHRVLPDMPYDGRPYPPLWQTLQQSIRLVDGHDGTPVGGAHVQAWFKLADSVVPWGGYTCDGNGRVVLDLPEHLSTPMGMVAVDTEHALTEFSLATDQLDAAASQRKEAVLKLARGRRLGGLVQDETGKPLRGANISISSTVGKADESGWVVCDWPTVQTDALGKWSLNAAPEKLQGLVLHISHPDFLAADFHMFDEQDSKSGELKEVELLAGKASVRLAQGLNLAGMVKDQNGKALSGAHVTLFLGANARTARKSTQTDTNGQFSFPVLKPGEVTLAVQAVGHAAIVRSAELAAGMAPLEVQLTPARPLQLRVVDEAGHPLEDAQVSTADDPEQGWFDFFARTDKSGAVTWPGAPAENASLRILRQGYRPVLLEVHYSTQPQTVTMAFDGRITGKVVDAVTKEPVPFCRLVALACDSNTDAGNWEALWARSIVGGRFVAGGLKTGQRWKLQVTAPNFEPAESAPFAGPTNLVVALWPPGARAGR
jgi:hypothetical protein